MDVVSHFGLTSALFGRDGGAVFRSNALSEARLALIAAIRAHESPVVLTGPAGTGKTMLLGLVARELAAEKVQAVYFAGPSQVAAQPFTAHVMLVDEADSADAARLSAVAVAARARGAVLVLAAIDTVSHAVRNIRLAPMSGREAYDFILDAAARAGRPDLFSAAAQEAIVAATHGVPRALKLIAGGALLEAMFEGGGVVEARHVIAAVAAKAPLPPPAPDYRTELPPAQPMHVAAPILLHDASDFEDTADDTFMPPPPEAERRRFDARGVIAGAAALGLLTTAVAAYGINSFGVDRIGEMLNPAPAAQTVLPEAVEAAPPVPVAIVASPPPLAVPAPEVDVQVLPLEITAPDPAFAAPPMPTAATPGYRPPSAKQPTLSAAVRAGIATKGPAVTRQQSDSLQAAPLSLGDTAPLDQAPPPAN